MKSVLIFYCLLSLASTAGEPLKPYTPYTRSYILGGFTPGTSAEATGLMKAVRDGSADAEVMNTAWNAGDAAMRELVLRVWLEHSETRAWKPDPSVLAQDPAANVRRIAAFVLGELVEGAPALGVIAAKDVGNRVTCAAVLLSVGNRQAEFLQSFAAESKTLGRDAHALLVAVGRSFPDVKTLLATEHLDTRPEFRAPLIRGVELGAAARQVPKPR